MRRFRDGEIQVLVATTVIEVGIDVPERDGHADRASRALRAGAAAPAARPGRAGAEESYCICMADGEARRPAHAFAATQDGFRIAELDLEERGMGDLIGARQTGGVEVRHARLPADADCSAAHAQLAMEIIGADPALQRAENSRLRERAVARYPRAVELFRVG